MVVCKYNLKQRVMTASTKEDNLTLGSGTWVVVAKDWRRGSWLRSRFARLDRRQRLVLREFNIEAVATMRTSKFCRFLH